MIKLNIRKGEYGYYTRLKNTQNDEEISMYVNVQFAKCGEPTETALQINIQDGFLSCYSSQDGIKVKVVVMEYEVLNVYDNNQENESHSNDTEDIKIDLDLSDELPF